MSDSLRSRVTSICTEVAAGIDDTALRDTVEGIGRSVADPLTVAVAGRLKAGKSTLVNALLGRRVAPVGIGECTKVVTCFRYDPQERVEVVPRSGAPWSLPFERDGSIPNDLGASHEQLARVDVWLSNALLERLTIVDTPGLDSLTPGVSAATEELLAVDDDSRSAIATADALIFLLPRLELVDSERLHAFRRMFDGTSLSPVNAVGVLSKADKVGAPGTDPLGEAADAAARCAEVLHDVVSTVVPVIGLLAETAEADRFSERDAEDLRRLAAAPDEIRKQLLLTADWFATTPFEPVSPERRADLLAQLDLFGVERALDGINSGHGGSRELVATLRELSGIGALRSIVEEHFGRRADALKAYVALGELERASFRADRNGDPAIGKAIRARIEVVRLDPDMHQLAELDAYHHWWSGAADLPSELACALRALVLESTPPARLGLAPSASAEACAERSLALATQWLAFQNDPRSTPAQVRVASVARESCTLLWEGATT